MPNLNEIREKYPEYNDMDDQTFADRFHQKFYSDMPREEFDTRLGITPSLPEVPAGAENNPTLFDAMFGDQAQPAPVAPQPAPVAPQPAPVAPQPEQGPFGLRRDGTQKDVGFLGLLERPDGRVSSELSIGVKIDGKETEIPAIVPGLTPQETDFLLNLQEGDGKAIPDSVQKKAKAHAIQRMNEGKSPFFNSNEQELEIDINAPLAPIADRLKAQQTPEFEPLTPRQPFNSPAEFGEALKKGGQFFKKHGPGGAELLVGGAEFVATDFLIRFFTEVPAGTINGAIEAFRAGDIDAFVEGFAASQGTLPIPGSEAGERVRQLFGEGVGKVFGAIDQQVEDYFADKGGVENNPEAAATLNVGLKSLLILAPFRKVGRFQGKPTTTIAKRSDVAPKGAAPSGKTKALNAILDLADPKHNPNPLERVAALKIARVELGKQNISVSKSEMAALNKRLAQLETVSNTSARAKVPFKAKEPVDVPAPKVEPKAAPVVTAPETKPVVPQDVATTTKRVNELAISARKATDPVQKLELEVQRQEAVIAGAQGRLDSALARGVNKGARGVRRTKEDRKIIARMKRIIPIKEAELTQAREQLELTKDQVSVGEQTARELDQGIIEQAGFARGIRPKEVTPEEAQLDLLAARTGEEIKPRLPSIATLKQQTLARKAQQAEALREDASPLIEPRQPVKGQKVLEADAPANKQIVSERKVALAKKSMPDAPGAAVAMAARTPKQFKENEGEDLTLVAPRPRDFFESLKNETGAIGEGGDGKPKIQRDVDDAVASNPEARQAREGHKKIRKDLDLAKKATAKETIQRFERAMTDRSVAVTDTLREGFTEKEANIVIAKHDIIPGANAESNLQYEAAHDAVFSGLGRGEKQLLDDLVFSRRVVALDKHASKQREVVIEGTEKAKAVDRKLRGKTGGPDFVRRARGELQRAKGKAEKTAARQKLKEAIAEAREIKQTVKNIKKSKSTRGVTIKDSEGNFESQSIIKDDLLHPNNTTGAIEQKFLDNLPAYVKAKVMPRVDALMAVYKDQLTQTKEAGLITEESYQNMIAVGDWSPRRFIQHMRIESLIPQPESKFRSFQKGSKISKSDVLHSLDKGSIEALELDSELLMHTVITRTQAAIARNKAAKSLYDLVKEHPDNGLLKIVNKDAKLPNGEEKIFVKIKGETHAISAPEQMASDWINMEPMMNAALARTFSHILGATVLRAGATVFNPLFALKNLPRDLQLIMFTGASKEYSKHLPVAYTQLAADIKATVNDVLVRGPEYRKAIKQGLGQDYLAQQSEFLSLTPKADAPVVNQLKQIGRVMQWAGVTSELMTRMAVRRRAIINGKKAFQTEHGREPTGTELEAIEEHGTWVARSYLDFSKGGALTKTLDVGLPYLNASVQAMTNVAKYAKSDPKLFSYKVGQIITFAAMLFAIRQQFPDQDAGISDQEKAGSMIIPLPMLGFKKDRDGNILIPYMRIAKDQTTGAIMSLTDYAMKKSLGIPADMDETNAALARMFSVVPGVGGVALPPTVAALIVLTGSYDPFTEKQVFEAPGGREVEGRAEYFDSTNPTWVKLSELAKDSVDWNVSAEGLRRAVGKVITPNNPLPIGVDIITRTMLDDLPGTAGLTYSEKVRNRFPFIDTLVRYPEGHNRQQLKEIRKARIERNTENVVFKKKVMDFFNTFEDDKDFKQKLRVFQREIINEAKALKSKRGATAADKLKARETFKRAKQIQNYAKFRAQLKKIGPVRNMRVWRAIGMLESELGATMLFSQVWLRASEAERKEIEKFAKKLPFVRGKAFTGSFNQLVKWRKAQEAKGK